MNLFFGRLRLVTGRLEASPRTDLLIWRYGITILVCGWYFGAAVQ